MQLVVASRCPITSRARSMAVGRPLKIASRLSADSAGANSGPAPMCTTQRAGPRPSAGSPDARGFRSGRRSGRVRGQTTAAARSRDRAAAARLGTGRLSYLDAGVVRRFPRCARPPGRCSSGAFVTSSRRRSRPRTTRRSPASQRRGGPVVIGTGFRDSGTDVCLRTRSGGCRRSSPRRSRRRRGARDRERAARAETQRAPARPAHTACRPTLGSRRYCWSRHQPRLARLVRRRTRAAVGASGIHRRLSVPPRPGVRRSRSLADPQGRP
jgi:hypothetical protein